MFFNNFLDNRTGRGRCPCIARGDIRFEQFCPVLGQADAIVGDGQMDQRRHRRVVMAITQISGT